MQGTLEMINSRVWSVTLKGVLFFTYFLKIPPDIQGPPALDPLLFSIFIDSLEGDISPLIIKSHPSLERCDICSRHDKLPS